MNVLKKSIQLYKKDLPTLLGLSLLISLCINAPLWFLVHDKSTGLLTKMLGVYDQQSLIAYPIWLLGFILLSTLAVKLNNLHNQKEQHIFECLKTALNQFFPLLLIAALYGIVVICGIVFLIIPGIILSVSCMFAFLIRLFDQREIFETLVESHRLVWGHWWYSVMMLSLPLLIHVFLLLACIILGSGLMAMVDDQLDSTLNLAFWANATLQVFIIPLILGLTVCMFYHLKTLSLKKHLEEL